MFKVPMKGDYKKEFATEVDWKHFHKWLKKAKGKK